MHAILHKLSVCERRQCIELYPLLVTEVYVNSEREEWMALVILRLAINIMCPPKRRCDGWAEEVRSDR